MLCKRCMIVMKPGTTYEHTMGNKKITVKRYRRCNKCNDKIYIEEPNFQEYLSKTIERKKK